MRQIWITRAGPPEVLAVKEAPDPQPKAGEVRIRVEASGVNFADIMGRMGLYPDLPPIPAVPGYEVAGRVDAVGAGADAALSGREVIALTNFGGYADVVCAPARQVFVRPAGMSALEGAALPVTLGHMMGEVERLRGWMDQLLALSAQGLVRPKIARSFRFEEAAQAHHFIQDRRNIGKVLLVP